MDRRMSEALDRHITGNYGEDQFDDGFGSIPWNEFEEPWPEECQVANCDEDSEDGVLCSAHNAEARAAEKQLERDQSVLEAQHWAALAAEEDE